jgi:hypothetical protein
LWGHKGYAGPCEGLTPARAADEEPPNEKSKEDSDDGERDAHDHAYGRFPEARFEEGDEPDNADEKDNKVRAAGYDKSHHGWIQGGFVNVKILKEEDGQ